MNGGIPYVSKPLSDSSVTYFRKKDVEAAVTDFLKRNYPEALRTPMPLDVVKVVERMGLEIEQHRITQDCSVFGQIFVTDCDAEVYDVDFSLMVEKHFDGGTILVYLEIFYLRNLLIPG